MDTWACTDKYSCSGSSNTPDSGDLDDADDPQDDDFMPITPSSISVEEFYIYVVPNEDPYRAFAEEDAQIQPQVTIILTVSLANDYSGGVLGEVPSITIQRTISTGVYSAITSYE